MATSISSLGQGITGQVYRGPFQPPPQTRIPQYQSAAPGNTPWWTDAQAQGAASGPYGNSNVNPGGAGADYTEVQNTPSADQETNPQYLAALAQLGYTGGNPNSPGGYQALNQFLQQRGLTSQTSFADGGTQTSRLVGPNGQPVDGTQRQYGSDVNEDAFLGAMLAAGLFGGAAAGIGGGAVGGGAGGLSSADTAALYGSDAAYGGGATAAGGGGLAGTGLPEFAAYGGEASAPLAGDATGTGIFDAGTTGAADGGSGTIAGGNGLSFGSSSSYANPYALNSAGSVAGGAGGAAGTGTSLLSSFGGTSGVGLGVSALNGVLGYVAANKAANVQSNAAQQAQAALNAQNALLQKNEAPYLAAGTQALGTIGDLMGTSGNTGAANYGMLNHQFNADDLKTSLAPNYQFQLDQGLGATANQANASGFSGNTLKGINDYAQNYAGGAYQQAFNNYTANQTNTYNRLANLAGLGQTANQVQAQVGSQNASGAAGYGTSAAAAQAAGIVGGTNAITNGLNNVNGWNYLSGISSPSQSVYSDARLKTDITRVGSTDSGIPLYTYRYKAGGPTQMGVMAQEVERIAPHAVTKDAHGFRRVNYTMLKDI